VSSVGIPPFSGSFTTVDPGLVAPAAGDLRPSPASKVVNVIPAAAAEDYFGCPRPRRPTATSAPSSSSRGRVRPTEVGS
jgi:hypothetical protein